MFTAGVDLSSQDRKTGICTVEWTNNRAAVVDMELDVSDQDIIAVIATAKKVGIDAPLGWPIAFVEALSSHSRDGSWPSDYQHADTSEFRLRRTDRWIWRELDLPQPLSVSTDRIALPAMRAAALLSSLPGIIPLDGSGVVVEVYPSAALNRWRLTSRGYKGKNNALSRDALVADFCAATHGWLTLSDQFVDLCRASDDAFDSLVAALVARAAAMSLVEQIPDGDQILARREGWVAIPKVNSLALLPNAP